MNHQHLPALNRYTSPNQYEALQDIDKTKSLTPLLMKGSMSKTVGSLIRSAWVSAQNVAGDDGVMREAWVITDAGRHAMQMYEAKMEEQRKMEAHLAKVRAERAAAEEKYFDACVKYYEKQLDLKAQERYIDMLSVGLVNWRNIADLARRKVEAESIKFTRS